MLFDENFNCKYLRFIKCIRHVGTRHFTNLLTSHLTFKAQWLPYIPFKSRWSLYAPSGLTFKKTPRSAPHSVCKCFVWISEQTAIISLYSINWLVCITETECVYCAVRSGSSYIILRSAHTVYLYVLCESENKQRLFPSTALTDWFV